MKKLPRSVLILVTALSIVFTTLGFSFQTAFAQEGQPPEKHPKEKQVESTVALIGPGSSLYGPIPGPGGQGGTLSSIIAWYGKYWSQGRAKITLQGGPTAKAWTTYSYTTPWDTGSQLGTTADNPCWTTTTCTSSTTDYYPSFTGYHYLNFAETIVYWSDGTQTYANATVTKTF